MNCELKSGQSDCLDIEAVLRAFLYRIEHYSETYERREMEIKRFARLIAGSESGGAAGE